MGCSQSSDIPLPPKIDPLWKGDTKVPVKFNVGPRYNKDYVKTTLVTQIQGTPASMYCSRAALVLSTNDDGIIAVCKRAGNGFKIYSQKPVFSQQNEAGPKHNGLPLYLYATVSSYGEVYFVHKPAASAFTIASGPQNSFEKYLVKAGYNCFAQWKYVNSKNRVEIKEAGCDVGLIVCLVFIADLMEAKAQMRQLNSTVASATLGNVKRAVVMAS